MYTIQQDKDAYNYIFSADRPNKKYSTLELKTMFVRYLEEYHMMLNCLDSGLVKIERALGVWQGTQESSLCVTALHLSRDDRDALERAVVGFL